jgi:hypothetical protein
MSNENINSDTVKPDVDFFQNEELFRLIDADFESKLDDAITELNEFVENNNGLDKSEVEKDELCGKAYSMLREYKTNLRDGLFNFHLNRPQYRFLTDLLLKKMEYDVNQLFIAIELTDLLGTMREGKFTTDEELVNFTATATNITYIYHLISTHTIKGLTKDAYTFSHVLLKIGELSKLISYYDTAAKHMNEKVSHWTMMMAGGGIAEAIPPSEKTMINAETGEIVVGEENIEEG